MFWTSSKLLATYSAPAWRDSSKSSSVTKLDDPATTTRVSGGDRLSSRSSGAGAGAAESITWKLTDEIGNLLVIGAGSATLSAGESYTNVDDFSAAFRRLLTALTTVGVPRCDRLGVRYLSIAADLPSEKRDRIVVFRSDGRGGTQSFGLNYVGILYGSSKENFVLRPGDIIAVP